MRERGLRRLGNQVMLDRMRVKTRAADDDQGAMRLVLAIARKCPCRQVRPVSVQIRSRDSMALALHWQRHWEDKGRVWLWKTVAGMDERWLVMMDKVSFELLKVAGRMLPSALVSFWQMRRGEE